jgi:hypothetical protein
VVKTERLELTVFAAMIRAHAFYLIFPLVRRRKHNTTEAPTPTQDPLSYSQRGTAPSQQSPVVTNRGSLLSMRAATWLVLCTLVSALHTPEWNFANVTTVEGAAEQAANSALLPAIKRKSALSTVRPMCDAA